SYLRQYRSFKKARTFARGLGLKTQAEWIEYSKSGKKPADIPTNPNNVYAKTGWKGFYDWLGTSWRHGEAWRPFKEARAFVRKLGVENEGEWRKYWNSGKKPPISPSHLKPSTPIRAG